MTQAKKRRSIRANLIAKACEDPTFRQKLLENPKAAISEALSVSLPDDIDIEVLEETPKKIYLVLPAPKKDQLSPEELANVATGSGAVGIEWHCGDTPAATSKVNG